MISGVARFCKQENELIALRQQLSKLCKHEPVAARSSPKTPAQRESLLDTTGFNGGSTKVKLDLHEAWSSSKPDAQSRDSQAVNKDVENSNSSTDTVTPCKGQSSSFPVGDEARATEEAKWYVNPMVETSQDFYNISTPERTNSMFSVCNPAVHGSFEWTVIRSSFASRESADPRLVESPPRNASIQVCHKIS